MSRAILDENVLAKTPTFFVLYSTISVGIA